MARAISIKIPTTSLIADVEQAIANIKQEIKDYPKARQQWEQDTADHKAKLIKLAIDALSKKKHLIGEDYNAVIRIRLNSHSNQPEITFDSKALGFPEAPVCPEEPNAKKWIGNTHTTRLEMLEKNLRLLKMTTQSEVNASTYSSIMELL